jgi:PAS domain S-box-containing protein
VSRITTISLQFRIIVLVLLSMTATFAFFAVWGGHARNQVRTQMEQERAVSVQLAAARVDSLIRRDLAELRGIAQELAEGTIARLQPQGTPILERDPDGSFSGGVYLIDTSGRLVAGSDPITGVSLGAVLPQSEVVSALVKGGQPGVSSALPFGSDNQSSLLVAVPLTPSGNQTGAVLFGVVQLADSGFVEAIQPLALGQTGYAEIFDKQGRPLVDTPPDRSFGTAVHELRLADLLSAGQPVTTKCHECHDPNGPITEQQVMAFAPIASAGWGVVAAQSEGEIIAPLRQLQWPLLIGSLILFGFALMFAWLAGRTVVRPLNRLMVACEGIADGDLERPVPSVGVGEIRRLANAFDTVRDRLAAALSEVFSWNAVLEERVREKTEDLSQSCDDLQASRDYLQAVVDSLTDEMQIVGREGTILQVNTARLASTGRRSDELVGRQCCSTLCGGEGECIRDEGGCLVSEVWETGKPGRSTSQECGHAGDGRFLEVAASPVRDADGNMIAVVEVMRDVTEGRQLQEEVMLRNRELSALNEVLLAASQSLDLEKVLGLVARTVGDVFGADAVAILLASRGGDTFWRAGMELPEPPLRALLLDAFAEEPVGEGSPLPVIAECGAGEAKPACEVLAAAGIGSVASVPLRFGDRSVAALALAFRASDGFSSRDAGLLRSISSQLALAIDRALLYREQQRAAARASSLLGIAREISALESLDHVLERIVDEAATLLGMEKAQLLLFGEDGMDTTVSVSAEGRTVQVAHQQPWQAYGIGGLAVSTGAPVWTADYGADERFSHAAQEYAWANGVRSAIAVPLQAGSRVIGALYVGSASVNQFQEEDVLVLLGFASHAAIAIENARLFSEAGKVEALRELDTLRSQLVSTVSHELRTPLAGIKAYATALLRTDVKRSDRMQRDYLNAIDQDCDRLTTLVEESLDMSRIRAGMPGLNREALSPATVIERAVAAMKPVAKRRVINVDVDPDLPPAWADRERVHQVLGNLLANALNFSKAPAPVTVSARLVEEGIRFAVSDRGMGLRPEEHERIFEPFYRGEGAAAARVRGTGLGLAISKGIVEAHGGRIWVESEAGKGATFYFTVPAQRVAKG